MTEDTSKVIRHTITQLLSRREHGYYELLQKLAHKGFVQDDVEPILEQFRESSIQSDARFADMQVRLGIQKGHGLNRIKQTLNQLHINSSDIQLALSENPVDWFALALQVKRKKFGEQLPEQLKEKAKQQRFLLYRGFSPEQINHALTTTGES